MHHEHQSGLRYISCSVCRVSLKARTEGVILGVLSSRVTIGFCDPRAFSRLAAFSRSQVLFSPCSSIFLPYGDPSCASSQSPRGRQLTYSCSEDLTILLTHFLSDMRRNTPTITSNYWRLSYAQRLRWWEGGTMRSFLPPFIILMPSPLLIHFEDIDWCVHSQHQRKSRIV